MKKVLILGIALTAVSISTRLQVRRRCQLRFGRFRELKNRAGTTDHEDHDRQRRI
jgi:hypothetical protein